jgi:hypothetical protein
MTATLISCGAFVPLAVKWPLPTRRVSRVAVKAAVTSSVIQSVCLVGKGRLKERCGLEPRTNFFFFRLRNWQKLVRIRFENIRYFLECGDTCWKAGMLLLLLTISVIYVPFLSGYSEPFMMFQF